MLFKHLSKFIKNETPPHKKNFSEIRLRQRTAPVIRQRLFVRWRLLKNSCDGTGLTSILRLIKQLLPAAQSNFCQKVRPCCKICQKRLCNRSVDAEGMTAAVQGLLVEGIQTTRGYYAVSKLTSWLSSR